MGYEPSRYVAPPVNIGGGLDRLHSAIDDILRRRQEKQMQQAAFEDARKRQEALVAANAAAATALAKDKERVRLAQRDDDFGAAAAKAAAGALKARAEGRLGDAAALEAKGGHYGLETNQSAGRELPGSLDAPAIPSLEHPSGDAQNIKRSITSSTLSDRRGYSTDADTPTHTWRDERLRESPLTNQTKALQQQLALAQPKILGERPPPSDASHAIIESPGLLMQILAEMRATGVGGGHAAALVTPGQVRDLGNQIEARSRFAQMPVAAPDPTVSYSRGGVPIGAPHDVISAMQARRKLAASMLGDGGAMMGALSSNPEARKAYKRAVASAMDAARNAPAADAAKGAQHQLDEELRLLAAQGRSENVMDRFSVGRNDRWDMRAEMRLNDTITKKKIDPRGQAANALASRLEIAKAEPSNGAALFSLQQQNAIMAQGGVASNLSNADTAGASGTAYYSYMEQVEAWADKKFAGDPPPITAAELIQLSDATLRANDVLMMRDWNAQVKQYRGSGWSSQRAADIAAENVRSHFSGFIPDSNLESFTPVDVSDDESTYIFGGAHSESKSSHGTKPAPTTASSRPRAKQTRAINVEDNASGAIIADVAEEFLKDNEPESESQ